MKILVVHSELGVLRGGGENFTRNLFRAFAKRGHEVWATFTADCNARYPILLPEEMRPIPLAGHWSRKFGQEALSAIASWLPEGSRVRASWDGLQESICWRTVLWHDGRFTRRIEQEFEGRWKEFDAVYVHTSAVLAARIAQHRPTVLRLPGPVSADLAPVLKNVHAVGAHGDALDQIRQFLGNHATEIPIGLDTDRFKPGPSDVRQELGWTEKDWIIGYVGRLAYIKGVDLLASAFKKVRKKIPHARLIIIGSGEEEGKLRTILTSELAEGFARFESDLSHEFLPDWYRAMDLFVMPSRYETLSHASIEALACGVPFLGADVGGNRYLADNVGGWLFSSGSVDSLAHTICFLAENPSLAKDRGAFGGEKVRKKYSWETSAGRLEAILHSCLDFKDKDPARLRIQ
jgi:glycosyltransferase involved in cell wall biosynthesis